MAANALRLVDVVGEFRGVAGDDIEQWIDRLLVALETMSGETETSKVHALAAKIVPMFVEGAAYTTWKQIAEKDDWAKITAALRKAYGKSPLAAWDALKQLKLVPGESVDALADVAKSLLKVVAGGTEPADNIVAFHLLDALPANVAEQIKLCVGSAINLHTVVDMAKTLLVPDAYALAAAGARPALNKQRQTTFETKKGPRCYGCRKFGHLLRECPMTCFACGGRGHMRKQCPTAGNAEARSDLPERALAEES